MKTIMLTSSVSRSKILINLDERKLLGAYTTRDGTIAEFSGDYSVTVTESPEEIDSIVKGKNINYKI